MKIILFKKYILLLLWLIFVPINPAYSTEKKAIIWITDNITDINEIIEFKERNNLDFSFSLLSSVYISTNNEIENIDDFKLYSKLFPFFFPDEFNISEIKGYEKNLVLFSLIFDFYHINVSTRSQGIITEFLPFKAEIIEIFNKNNYLWIYDKIHRKVITTGKDKNIFDVETFISTEIIRGPIFLINDRDNKTSSVSILKEIFERKDLKFVKLSELINPDISRSSDTIIEQNKIEINFNCEKEKNYILYLLKISEEIGQAISENNDIINLFHQLFDYYQDICNDNETIYDDIRRITKDIYKIANLSPPDFIYYDFLSEPLIKKHKKLKKDNLISFTPVIESSLYFEINKEEKSYKFKVSFSTENLKELQIYIDINKRINAGLDNIIGRNEKIDPLYGWEYAILVDLKRKDVFFYEAKTREYIKKAKYSLKIEDNAITFSIPEDIMKGNFINWNYILLALSERDIIDGIYKIVNQKFLIPED